MVIEFKKCSFFLPSSKEKHDNFFFQIKNHFFQRDKQTNVPPGYNVASLAFISSIVKEAGISKSQLLNLSQGVCVGGRTFPSRYV